MSSICQRSVYYQNVKKITTIGISAVVKTRIMFSI